MDKQPPDPRTPPGGPGAGGQPGGPQAGAAPGITLAGQLLRAAGPGSRYRTLGDDAVITAVGRWHSVGAWAASQQLAAVREAIRRHPAAGHEPSADGQLPAVWGKDLAEQIALELAISRTAADKLITLAWTLETRLPLTAAALDAGILDLPKASLIAQETAVLSGPDAAAAEELAAGKWAGKTWSQLKALITRAVINTDPEGARRRREQAEKEDARVRFWREHAGTAGLAGYGLPTDRALRAHAKIQARARAYRAWGIPGTLDQLRVLAYLDKLLDTDSRDNYPRKPAAGAGRPGAAPAAGAYDDAEDDDQNGEHDGEHDGDGGDWDDGDQDSGDGGDSEDQDGEDQDGEDGGGPGNGPDGGGPDEGPSGHDGPRGGGAAADDGLPANLDLTIPLTDLLGLASQARRAGEAHSLGALDPALARRLAASAARHPRTTIQLIITDPQGHAAGFGLAVPARKRKPGADQPPRPPRDRPGSTRDDTAIAALTPAGTGPPDGYGTWTLTIGDLDLTVRLHSIPRGPGCDHRYQSAGYQPSPTLRRLVQIRDGQCAMPVCTRHPRSCDFEHAIPWPQGPSCSCNGGTHCRHDHHIKQTTGWTITQHPDGRRTWTTPAGLTYTSQPREYPT